VLTRPSDKFFATLEKWLLDRWKVDPEANWWDKEPRRSRFDDREQMRSSHSHGSQPTIERYGTYLEWHVMFCGLGEWLKTERLALPDWASDKFDEYARRWGLSEPPTWLADRRGFTPLKADFVFDEGGEDKHWLRRVPKNKFLSAILGGQDSIMLAVEGDWTISRLKRQTEISVHSALVSPQTALSLLRTMQVADRYKFHLPFEREEEDGDVDCGPYVLHAWLAHVTRETGCDANDPLRNEVTGLSVQPAGWLVKKHRLKGEGTPASAWCRLSGQAWFTYEAWSDFGMSEKDPRYSQRQVGAYGYRLKVDHQALQTVLTRERLDLIVKVEIERRLENEYGEASSWNDKEKHCTTHKFFIFRQNGTIEDESGRLATWVRASKGAGRLRRSRLARQLDGASSRRKVSA
jgi:hypothetical protein